MKPSEPSFAEKFRHHDPLRFPLRLSVLCDKNCDCSVPSALQHVWIPGSQCRSNVGRIKDRSDAAPAVCWCIHVYHSGLVDTEQRRGFKIDGSTNDGMPTQARAWHPGSFTLHSNSCRHVVWIRALAESQGGWPWTRFLDNVLECTVVVRMNVRAIRIEYSSRWRFVRPFPVMIRRMPRRIILLVFCGKSTICGGKRIVYIIVPARLKATYPFFVCFLIARLAEETLCITCILERWQH